LDYDNGMKIEKNPERTNPEISLFLPNKTYNMLQAISKHIESDIETEVLLQLSFFMYMERILKEGFKIMQDVGLHENLVELMEFVETEENLEVPSRTNNMQIGKKVSLNLPSEIITEFESAARRLGLCQENCDNPSEYLMTRALGVVSSMYINAHDNNLNVWSIAPNDRVGVDGENLGPNAIILHYEGMRQIN